MCNGFLNILNSSKILKYVSHIRETESLEEFWVKSHFNFYVFISPSFLQPFSCGPTLASPGASKKPAPWTHPSEILIYSVVGGAWSCASV